MKNLIIISDLWGAEKSVYLQEYRALLEKDYIVTILDARAEAGIQTINLTQKEIHNAFVNGGIDRAVNVLSTMSSESYILAFSVGGTIAWKAMLSGLQVEKLIAVSVTRLRYETTEPSGDIHLIYGAEDAYLPPEQWRKARNSNILVLKGQDHDLYKNTDLLFPIIQQMLKS